MITLKKKRFVENQSFITHGTSIIVCKSNKLSVFKHFPKYFIGLLLN